MSNFDLYQTITDRIIELMENEKLDWSKGWSSIVSAPHSTRARYTGMNWVSLSIASMAYEYKSNLWLTFKDIQAIDGAHLKKGSKSEMVIYYKTLEVEKDNAKEYIPMIKYYRVFNADCVENLPEKYIETLDLYEHDETDAFNRADEIVASMPNAPKITAELSSRAFYRPSEDSIYIPSREQYENENEYYSTLFHELTHSTGHKSRLDRHDKSEQFHFGNDDYSKEELVAELGNAYLMNIAGISAPDTMKNSAGYIQGWLKQLKNDKKFIFSASSKAQKAVNYILNAE